MNRFLSCVFVFFICFATLIFQSNDTTSTYAGEGDATVYLPLLFYAPAEPSILSFTSDKTITDLGDMIALTWTSINGMGATLYHVQPSGQLGTWWEVDPNGSFTYEIATNEYNATRFLLFVYADSEIYAQAELAVTLNCLDEWFFDSPPDVCPSAAPLISDAAEQQFEHGSMIWIKEEDVILVLFDDEIFSPKWLAFSDDWNDGDMVEDPAIDPPDGYYEPERGFGLVWREQEAVRDRLGWALVPEVGYETAVQRTSYYKYNHTYPTSADRMLFHLFAERARWEKRPLTE